MQFQDNGSSIDGNNEQTVRTLLRQWGYEPIDFTIEEHYGAGIANMLGLDGGILTVRRISTGEERLYATGVGSAWFGAFFMDLGWGHFRKVARCSASIPG